MPSRSKSPRMSLSKTSTTRLRSSLSYLRNLPVDMVKIDQVFIADVCRSDAGRTIVAAINDLAHALGFCVTAEGVETQEQDDAVMAIGCDFAQGFLYSRAVSAADLLARVVGLRQSA